jgi:uncharacterized protein
MGQPVVHFEVQAKDPEKLQRFYGDLFEWNINTDNPMNYGMVETGGDGGINGGIGGTQGDGGVCWYVQVDDLDAYLRKAEEAGGKRLGDPMEVPDGPKLAWFEDPEGNQVGLVSGM